MDPLSIAASATGLVLFIKEVAQLSSDLYRAVKRKPHILKAISEDLEALQALLEELGSTYRSPDAGDVPEHDALAKVLSSCGRTVNDINSHLNVLQQMFSKKLVSRLMSYKKFDEETKAIVTLRDELGAFKATLSLALHVRIL